MKHMQETSPQQIEQLLFKHKHYFSTQQTKGIAFRKQKLRDLKEAILAFQPLIEQALWKDLHKSKEEVYLTEISLLLKEIDSHIKHIDRWTKPQSVPTPIYLQPSKSSIMYEPYGLALILAPWNYPFQLLINPLIGAITAGCCAMVKPSPSTPHVAIVIEELLQSIFQPEYISVIQGGKTTNQALFKHQFDIIFFTGSSFVGKLVMKAAAEHLTPVVLELGGKSPCIVDSGADVDVAAKRIAFGKGLNAGQTCIAPDHLFVHKSVKKELLKKIKEHFHTMYGENILKSRFFGRIVDEQAWERLVNYLNEGKIYSGGTTDKTSKYIEPTILEIDNVYAESMKREIFGPILPVITFSDLEEVVGYINSQPKPLAFYYFGNQNTAKQTLQATTSGGACINDTLMHVSNPHLPFGGVGNSGMGRYHGKESFLAFSNQRAVIQSPTWFDNPLKYPPFKQFKYLKKMI